jgi:hypothetical protein
MTRIPLGWVGRMVEFSGFGNGRGEISFNKLCTFTALQTFVYSVITKRDPSWALLSFGIVVIGAGFGIKGYLAAVKQNTLAATQTAATSASVTLTGDLAKIAEVVTARRDHSTGMEAT